jgi:hypothetical protein
MPENNDSYSSPFWLFDPIANLNGTNNTFYKNYNFTGQSAHKAAADLITSPEFGKFWTGKKNSSYSIYRQDSANTTLGAINRPPVNYGKTKWQITDKSQFFSNPELPTIPADYRPVELDPYGVPLLDPDTKNFIPSDYNSIPLNDVESEFWVEYSNAAEQRSTFNRMKSVPFTNDKPEYVDQRGALPRDERIRLAKLQGHERLNFGEETRETLAVNQGEAYQKTTANYLKSTDYKTGNTQYGKTPLMLTPLEQSNVDLDVRLYTGNEINRAARNYSSTGLEWTKHSDDPRNFKPASWWDTPDKYNSVGQRPILVTNPTQSRQIGTMQPRTMDLSHIPNQNPPFEKLSGSNINIKGPPIVTNRYTGTGFGKMPNMTNVGNIFGAVTGGLGTAYQLYDQVNAVTGRNGDTTLDREYGGSDPLSLRAGMDVGLDIATGNFGPQTVRNYEQRVNDPEYIARNPLSSMVGQGMRGNMDYLKAFYNAQLFVPKFAQFNENKTMYNASSGNLERVGLYKRDYAGQGFVGK